MRADHMHHQGVMHSTRGHMGAAARTRGNGRADTWEQPRGGAVEGWRVSPYDLSTYVVRQYTRAAASSAVVGEADRFMLTVTVVQVGMSGPSHGS